MSFAKKVIQLATWWQCLGRVGREQAKEKLLATTVITVFVLAFCLHGPGFVRISACLVIAGFWLLTCLDIAALKPRIHVSEIRRRIIDKE